MVFFAILLELSELLSMINRYNGQQLGQGGQVSVSHTRCKRSFWTR